MSTAVFSVVHPGVEPYFAEFLGSLSNQADRNFILFLINDGLCNIERFLETFDMPVKVKKAAGSPAALRKVGIKWVTDEGAEVIVFADSDDYFAENRTQVSREMLTDFDLVFNELMLVGKESPQPVPMLGQHFRQGKKIGAAQVKFANCMGLSNTAVRADKIPVFAPQIPDAIVAFDWALFAMCLNTGARAVFTKETRTYYRQYGNNAASPRFFTEEQILQGVLVKRDHYQLLSQFYEEYEQLAQVFKQLLEQLQSDAFLKQKYCLAVRLQSPPTPLWWEAIKSLEELGL